MKNINGYFLPAEETQYEQYFKNFQNYQEAQRNRALSYVKKFGIAVDIGANLGLWAKELSNFFSKTICFEPNKNCLEYLKKNVQIEKTIIHNCALGKKKEHKKLFCPINSGNSSFINKTKVGTNEDRKKIIGNFPTNTETQTVEVKTLDSFDLKNINFIKIDVQGYEFEVLAGGEKTFLNNRCVVCIETESSDYFRINNVLNSWGYTMVDKILKEAVFVNIKS